MELLILFQSMPAQCSDMGCLLFDDLAFAVTYHNF
jgi:hypothetical protein